MPKKIIGDIRPRCYNGFRGKKIICRYPKCTCKEGIPGIEAMKIFKTLQDEKIKR